MANCLCTHKRIILVFISQVDNQFESVICKGLTTKRFMLWHSTFIFCMELIWSLKLLWRSLFPVYFSWFPWMVCQHRLCSKWHLNGTSWQRLHTQQLIVMIQKITSIILFIFDSFINDKVITLAVQNRYHIEGLVQDWHNSSALAMELPEPYTKPMYFQIWQYKRNHINFIRMAIEDFCKVDRSYQPNTTKIGIIVMAKHKTLVTSVH